jgi:hypothetical protein
MFLQIPGLILVGIAIVGLIVIVMAVFGWGLFKAAEKDMADNVVSEKETERRSPDSDLKKPSE